MYDLGAGPPLLVMPNPQGMVGAPEACSPLVDRLVGLGWRVATFDPPVRLPRRAPTLVCVGRHDPQTPWPANAAIAAAPPAGHLEVFERSGHYPFIEEPDRFAAVVAGPSPPPQRATGCAGDVLPGPGRLHVDPEHPLGTSAEVQAGQADRP